MWKIIIIFFAWIVLMQSAQAAQSCRTDIPQSTPNNRFIINGDEVTDKVTGLIWQRCSLGQSGADCSMGSAATYNWSEALQAAESVRASTGKGWRLPNIKELQSIVEEACYNPAINLSVFPGTASSDFWSATPNAYSSSNAWYVHIGYGYSYSYGRSYSFYVRHVRAGQ